MPKTLPRVGVVCGSGSAMVLPDRMFSEKHQFDQTPYGAASSAISVSKHVAGDICLLYRHGEDHSFAPHQINYRANVWALSQLQCDVVVAIATVGSIRKGLEPGALVLPDQFIDYTWGRQSTFFEGDGAEVRHLEVSTPYSSQLSQLIVKAASQVDVNLNEGGVYAVTQGPRFETPAEINRIEKDGGDVVGMTGMPEVALAAEKGLCYACIAIVVNPAAGRGKGPVLEAEIRTAMKIGYANLNQLLEALFDELAQMGDARPLVPDTHLL